MARLLQNSTVIWPLLISCLFLQVLGSLPTFPEIKHYDKSNGASYSFLVIGDWGEEGKDDQAAVAEQMGKIGEKLQIDFVISVGDNFYPKGLSGANDPIFQKSFTNVYTAESLKKPWYAGNKDYHGNVAAQFSPQLTQRDPRWHCKRNFIVGAGFMDIFFIDTTPFVDKYFNSPKKLKSIDHESIEPRERYISTLKKGLDLKLQRSKAHWKIVVGHHTIKSIGEHGATQEIVQQVLPILEAHNVDMYINGHDHCLQHFTNQNRSMHFFTSGAGSKAEEYVFERATHENTKRFYANVPGFMSVTVAYKKAVIAFYDVSGKTLHSQVIPKNENRTSRKQFYL